MDANEIINGTYGKVLIDGDQVSEAYGLQAKVNIKFADVNLCGDEWTHKKQIGLEGTGSIKLYKVNNRMGKAMEAQLNGGKKTYFTISSFLEDPDSVEAERIVLKNVIFTDLTLADWTAAKEGQIDAPFVFAGYRYL